MLTERQSVMRKKNSALLGNRDDLRDPEVNLFRGDSKSLLQEIPIGSVELVITSPPYNIGKAYEKKSGLQLEKYISWYKEIIRLLYEAISDSGSVCWQTGNYVKNGEVFPLDMHFYPIFRDAGFKLRNRIIWHFGHGLHCTRRFSGRYETILWFTKSDNYTFNLDNVRIPAKYPGKRYHSGKKKGAPSGNPKGKNPSDFWGELSREIDNGVFEIPNVKANHPEKTEHPCQFPVELAERCILAFTEGGQTILDPFAGVGSAGIAAWRLGRNSILIEKDRGYYQLALDRIQKCRVGELKVREMGTPIYVPKPSEKVAQRPSEWGEAIGEEGALGR